MSDTTTPIEHTASILNRLAARALGMTGADIQRIVKEARSKARRENRGLQFADLEAGLRQHRPKRSPERLHSTAVHEAGHVLVHHLLRLGPIAGVTIDDASGGFGTLGFKSDAMSDKKWIDDTLTMLMAGRAAEQLVLGEVSAGSGGSDDSDLARATNLAFSLERTLGLGIEFPLLYRPHHSQTAVLDANPDLAAQVHGHLVRAEERAGRLIEESRIAFDALVQELVRVQALDGAEAVRILKANGALPRP